VTACWRLRRTPWDRGNTRRPTLTTWWAISSPARWEGRKAFTPTDGNLVCIYPVRLWPIPISCTCRWSPGTTRRNPAPHSATLRGCRDERRLPGGLWPQRQYAGACGSQRHGNHHLHASLECGESL